MPEIFFTQYKSGSDRPSDIVVKEHHLGRELLKAAVVKIYGFVIDDDDIAVSPSGKPYFTDRPWIHFNISHCDGLVVCAVDDQPLGVDVERIGYFPKILINKALTESERLYFDKMSSAAFDPDELFYRFWTLKEAYVKLSGKGVDTDLRAFSFIFPDLSAAFSASDFTKLNSDRMLYTDVLCSDPQVSCRQIKLESGHLISLCMSGRRPPVILSEFTIL